MLPLEDIALSGGITATLGRAKGGGATYRKAEPREDALLETMFGDPPKGSPEGNLGNF